MMKRTDYQRLTRKKFLNYIRTLAALLMAGAAFAACSGSDDIISETQQPANPTEPQVYTLVIKASKSTNATTRALKEGYDSEKAKNTVDAYWTGNEKIDVAEIQGPNPVKIGTAKAAPSADGNTTITATLTAPSGIGDYIYFYLNGTNLDYTGQVGLLTGAGSISEKYDYAEGILDRGSITVSGDKIITNDGVTLGFDSSQAIVKFTLVDKANNDAPIYAKSLTIHDGKEQGLIKINNSFGREDIEYDDVIITPSGNSNVIYAALSYVYQSSLTLTATDGTDTYIYTKSDVSFINGKYYEITVKMTRQPRTYDLSQASSYTDDGNGFHVILAKDGDVLTGTFTDDDGNRYIQIADGATVTLDGVSINADGAWTSGNCAGITCQGDATIILKDGTTNTVKGFNSKYPGIFVPGNTDNPTNNNTLTIQGTGTLNASSNGSAPGIGGGYEISCGNIVIESGTITATGGQGAAGIGSGYGGCCGNITISGGTVTAYGGQYGAGIGSGDGGSCGDITITKDIVYVIATRGEDAESIGRGRNGSCGKIWFDTKEVYDGSNWIVSLGSGISYGDLYFFKNGDDTWLLKPPIHDNDDDPPVIHGPIG